MNGNSEGQRSRRLTIRQATALVTTSTPGLAGATLELARALSALRQLEAVSPHKTKDPRVAEAIVAVKTHEATVQALARRVARTLTFAGADIMTTMFAARALCEESLVAATISRGTRDIVLAQLTCACILEHEGLAHAIATD